MIFFWNIHGVGPAGVWNLEPAQQTGALSTVLARRYAVIELIFTVHTDGRFLQSDPQPLILSSAILFSNLFTLKTPKEKLIR